MLSNKIIKELEDSKKYQIAHIEAGIEKAIEIIKKHEKEFEQTIKKAFLASKLELSDYKSAQDYYNQNYKK